MKKINIFKYLDYRAFLKDYYTTQKKRQVRFSYRYFAKKANISSGNFIHMIIQGKRNLTKDFIPKLGKAMSLNKDELHYFETLVSFNQVKDAESRHYYLNLLNGLRKKKPGTILDQSQFEYISNWYYPAIRELVTVPHFQNDASWIAKELGSKITAKQASEAIETLKRLKMVEEDERGKLVQTEANIMTENYVADVAAFAFHNQMLTLAKEMLNHLTSGENKIISGVTMALSVKQFDEIKRRIHEFEDSILRYTVETHDVPETVFQFNFQLFPLSNGGN